MQTPGAGGDRVERVMTIAVTGAGGYVGEAVCRALVARGIAVRALARRDPRIDGTTYSHYDLRHELAPGLLADVDAIIHAATETVRGSEPDIAMEIAALGRLLDAAKVASARMIFISSQTARHDAPTGYGRLKAMAEQIVLEQQGIVVRPGQVYGGAEKGLWGVLAAMARHSPMIPQFLPEPRVQPIHVDDLAAALVALSGDARSASRHYLVADPRSVAFSRFIRWVALCRFGRWPARIPVPLAPILGAIQAVALLGIRPGFARRLASLNDLPALDSAADMAALVPQFRQFPDGAGHGSGHEASLLREGYVLLRYATGRRPCRWLVRRYVRALSGLAELRPLELSWLARRVPVWLALYDQPNARRRVGDADALSRRIDLALLVAESSVAHVEAFLLSPRSSTRIAQMLTLGWALPVELLGRLTDGVAGRWLDRLRPRPIGGDRDGA